MHSRLFSSFPGLGGFSRSGNRGKNGLAMVSEHKGCRRLLHPLSLGRVADEGQPGVQVMQSDRPRFSPFAVVHVRIASIPNLWRRYVSYGL